ncbi:MAG: hypothetical protein NTX25_12990, partial [Proteobacteria bacterium]|nr:hypothetical protein [Pseudomonadota bacterium]
MLIALALVITSCSGDMKVTTVPNYKKYKNTPLGVEVLKLSSSDTQDRSYGEGSVITLDMLLTDALTVDDPSTLSIPLVLGENIRQANYSSGNGSAVFHFVYQVAAGDNSPHLQYAEGASLALTPLAIAGKKLVQAKIQPKTLTLPATTALESLGPLKKIIIDTTAPTTASNVGFATALSASTDLVFSWSAASDANLSSYNAKLCTSNDCANGCLTATTTVALTTSLTGANGSSYYGCVQASDTAGNLSAWVPSLQNVTIDTSAPSDERISINGGASYSSTLNVVLSLAASGADEMYITNSADCNSGGSWESYKASKAWTLGQTNARATVYAKYRNVAGNESSCVFDNIIHDAGTAS